MRIDLHSHSNASDGTEPPAEVVRRAAVAGLDVLALTDHDTVAGIDEAAGALPPGLTLAPGAEISCRIDGISLHLLAYLFDPAHAELADEMRKMRESREQRGRAIIDRARELGAPVTWEQVERLAQGGAVGRPHVARALVAAGVVSTVAEAFSSEWLGKDGRAYVKKYALHPQRALELVLDAGGVPVFAHSKAAARGPIVGDDVIVRMVGWGLAGLEVDHPDHPAQARAELRALADRHGLFITGSSDDHGTITGHRLGCETTAPEAYQQIVERGRRKPLTA